MSVTKATKLHKGDCIFRQHLVHSKSKQPGITWPNRSQGPLTTLELEGWLECSTSSRSRGGRERASRKSFNFWQNQVDYEFSLVLLLLSLFVVGERKATGGKGVVLLLRLYSNPFSERPTPLGRVHRGDGQIPTRFSIKDP